MEFETITLKQDEVEKGVFILTLNRPKSLNALNTQMGLDLIHCLDSLNKKSVLALPGW